MNANPVIWFEIYVNDIERAKAFYEQVLDLELSPIDTPDDRLTMLGFPMSETSPGAGGALCHMSDMPAGGNSTLVYFNSDDCAVEAARVEAAGGTLLQNKMSIGEYGFVALAKDPDGNMFGVYTSPAG